VRCSRTGPTGFTVEFENADEVLREYGTNLSMGGLRLETAERPALHSILTITLRGPFGAVEELPATVVAPLPGGVALAVGALPKDLPDRLLVKTVREAVAARDAEDAENPSGESGAAAGPQYTSGTKAWLSIGGRT